MKKMSVMLVFIKFMIVGMVVVVVAVDDNSHDRVRRVVGGQVPVKGKYPYLVSLLCNYSPDSGLQSKHVAGGAILNKWWILTAAHSSPSELHCDMLIRAGKHYLNITESTEQVIPVANSIVHDNYYLNILKRNNGSTVLVNMKNDIALVKLRKPLRFNKFVSPIDLPEAESLPSGIAILSGWGLFYLNSTMLKHKSWINNTVLRSAKLPIIDSNNCKKSFKRFHNVSDISLFVTNVCTGSGNGSYGGCRGDSGGPLVLETNSRPQIIGIASWSEIPCGISPTVYTRVSAYVDWISKTIRTY